MNANSSRSHAICTFYVNITRSSSSSSSSRGSGVGVAKGEGVCEGEGSDPVGEENEEVTPLLIPPFDYEY